MDVVLLPFGISISPKPFSAGLREKLITKEKKLCRSKINFNSRFELYKPRFELHKPNLELYKPKFGL